MLARFAGFEFRYQLFSPMFVVVALAFFLLSFGIMAVPQASAALAGASNVNSPFVVSQLVLVLSVYGVFIPTAFLSGVVLRDRHFSTEALFFTTPISEFDYLAGRFLGAFVVTVLAFAVVPVGLFLGSVAPWLDPETLGPIRPFDYVYALFVLGLPNLLIPGALMFTVANVTRSTMATYTALVAVLILYLTGSTLLSEPEFRTTVAILDPFGVNAFSEATRYWTPIELDTRLTPLEGVFLWNRLLWLAVAGGLLALNVRLFSFRARGVSFLRRAPKADALADKPAGEEVELPHAAPRFGPGVAAAQFLARVRYELRLMVRSVTFWVLLTLGVFMVLIALFNLNLLYGTPVYPVTRVVMSIALAQFSLVPIVVIIYFAAELFWRDRVHRAHEIIDATPTPSWVFVFSKLVAMWVLMFAILAVACLAAIGFQLSQGQTDVEPWLWTRRIVLDGAITLCYAATLSMFVQVLANNRFIGMLVMVGYLISSSVLGYLGFQHNLYQFGGTPGAPYSDMNGDGHFVRAVLWFDLYWGFFVAILAVLTFTLWNRGALTPIWRRLRSLPARLAPATNAALAVFLIGFVATGSFIFYNTNILNTYQTTKSIERRAVAYEEAYRQYEDLPQPRITDVQADVDIYPRERRYEARGRYVIENKTDAPIAQVHVGYGFGTIVRDQTLEGGVIAEADDELNHYVWELDTPMRPGEARTLAFTVARENPGFRNGSNISSVVWNGTFFNNDESFPWIGFNRRRILQARNVRRRYGLEPVDRLPPLEDEEAARSNYIRADSDWVTFETTVSTSPDQIAVAPGYLQREWEEDGRRYFHYKMDAPILDFFSYLSARYTIAEEDADGVKLQVFHHTRHDRNVARMLDAMRDGIAYYSEAFGPFQHQQMRIFEFPSFFGTFAQSFPNSVPFSEGAGFIADNTDPEDIDYVYYITAHELAHQWWAHQVIGGDVQGGTMLSETFAQYSALMLMEHEYGEHHIRRFLKYELDNYLSARGGEAIEELPLYRVENQPYIHYRKGSVVMYALKDYLGEATVNRALARLIAETAYHSDPYPRSTDFLRILREEAGPEHETLIEDLFEKIVLFDLRATDVAVSERADGRFDVTLTVQARKLEADGEGAETEVPLDYMIDVGLFTEHPDDVAEGSDHVILLEKRPVHDGENVFEFVVDRAPRVAGIDPYNKLIDRDSDDNLRRVGAAAAASAAPEDEPA